MNIIKGILFTILAIALGGLITAALLVPEHYYEKISNALFNSSSQPQPSSSVASSTPKPSVAPQPRTSTSAIFTKI